jgi:threonine/homoserine/homoserine lactone efflux protein
MPVGPIGLTCLRCSLTLGWRAGFIAGLGAASADALYGALAGFGVTAIGSFLADYHHLLKLAGALFLCYLGLATFFTKAQAKSGFLLMSKAWKLFGTVFLLTIVNPLTILSFAAVYSTLGISSGDLLSALTLTGGVFIGSALWWLILSWGASLFKTHMDEKKSNRLNKVSGAVLVGFGLAPFVIA